VEKQQFPSHIHLRPELQKSRSNMTFGISTASPGRGTLDPMSRPFNAFPTTPCDECLGNTEKHLQTDAGLALYCEHEAALALCEHNRWRVISPLTFDEAAAVLEACVTARKITEIDDSEIEDARMRASDFQPWRPARIQTQRTAAAPAPRRANAASR
jgi:hypothetical protein